MNAAAAAYSTNLHFVLATLSRRHRRASFRALSSRKTNTWRDCFRADWPSGVVTHLRRRQWSPPDQMQTAGRDSQHAARPLQKTFNSIWRIDGWGLECDRGVRRASTYIRRYIQSIGPLTVSSELYLFYPKGAICKNLLPVEVILHTNRWRQSKLTTHCC